MAESYLDELRKIPKEKLEVMISSMKTYMKILKKDLELMEIIFKEKS